MDRCRTAIAAGLASLLMVSPARADDDSRQPASEWTFAEFFVAATSIAGYVQTAANVLAMLSGEHPEAAPVDSPVIDRVNTSPSLAAAPETSDSIAPDGPTPAVACAPESTREVTLLLPAEYRFELSTPAPAKLLWVSSESKPSDGSCDRSAFRRVTHTSCTTIARQGTAESLVVYRIAANAAVRAGSTERCR